MLSVWQFPRDKNYCNEQINPMHTNRVEEVVICQLMGSGRLER